MLRREDALRLCAATQAAYAVAAGPAGWLTVTDALQRRVAEEEGFRTCDGGVDDAVAYIRGAQRAFAGDAEVLSIPLYVRFNRCRAGALAPGDAAPDAPLLLADGRTRCSVLALHAALCGDGGAQPRAPLLLVGGSYT
jgi:hypothetical protein